MKITEINGRKKLKAEKEGKKWRIKKDRTTKGKKENSIHILNLNIS
jgi:hypothetical protein